MKIREVKGIGEKTERLFQKLGVFTTQELLEFYPRNYDWYQPPITTDELDNRQIAAFLCVITTSPVLRQTKRGSVLLLTGKDGCGSEITLKWYNMPFLRNKFKIGNHFIFRGKVTANHFYGKEKAQGKYTIEQPEIFTREEYEKKLDYLSPIYHLTQGLSNKLVTKSVRQVLDSDYPCYEFLPELIKEQYGLISYREAIEQIHFPTDHKAMEMARKRLAFQEFFLFILALRKFKDEKNQSINRYPIPAAPQTDDFICKLPYTLTASQQRVIDEMRKDFLAKQPMNRLIQGDVGSGKTIVSIIGLLDAVYAGYQAALMAPTEVLAAQHYEGITRLFEESGINAKVELLSGSMTAKAKQEACERIASGDSDIVIGTHAVIEDRVKFKNLAFAVTDEQHRFGVKQREKLAEKGERPHIMVMSATPIPRTLAIILYGDLDISVIDELPKGRLPIKNCVVGKEFRKNAYRFLAGQVENGHQCYVICPMVEESETLEAEDVVSYTERLRTELPKEIHVEYLHGKMKPAQKNEIMEEFAADKIQVLVSTTVIEVGINVPNATVMMVENAERFGLASLHQLRGRVGRGSAQSYCIFVSTSDKAETKERLDILNRSNDGFEIANWDLKLRGPGDFFGIRQSGDMDFKIADIYSDATTLKEASDAVSYIEAHSRELDPGTMQMLENKLQNYLENSFHINL